MADPSSNGSSRGSAFDLISGDDIEDNGRLRGRLSPLSPPGSQNQERQEARTTGFTTQLGSRRLSESGSRVPTISTGHFSSGSPDALSPASSMASNSSSTRSRVLSGHESSGASGLLGSGGSSGPPPLARKRSVQWLTEGYHRSSRAASSNSQRSIGGMSIPRRGSRSSVNSANSLNLTPSTGGEREALQRRSSSVSLTRCEACATPIVDCDPIEWEPEIHKTKLWSSCFSIQCCAIAACLFALLLFASALFLPGLFNDILRQTIGNSLVVDSPSAPGFASFECSTAGDTDDAVLLKIFAFDVNNHQAVIAGTAKPELIEHGPFVYKVSQNKMNISWTQDAELVHYKDWNQFKFMPELSASDDQKTIVTVPNLGLHAVYYKVVRSLPEWMRWDALRIAYRDAHHEDLFIKLSVRELLFGYHDSRLVQSGKSQSHDSKVRRRPEMQDLFRMFEKRPVVPGAASPANNFPGLVPNSTAEHVAAGTWAKSSMHTGKFVRKLMHNVNTIKGSDQLKVCTSLFGCPPFEQELLWGSEHANAVRGSDGTYFDPRTVKAHKPVTLFVGPINRAVQLVAVSTVPNSAEEAVRKLGSDDDGGGEKTSIDGIDVVEYELDPSTYANSSEVPSNSDYYNFKTRYGLMNFSRPSQDIPMVVSNPHFYKADPSLAAAVNGLSPANASAHRCGALLHPVTGIPVRTFQRFQYNLDMMPLPMGGLGGSLLAPHLNPVVVPVFWMDTVEQLGKEHLDLFELCDFATSVVNYVHVGSYILGGLALLVAIVSNHVHTQRNERLELRRRQSGLYEALLVETGDESTPYYLNTWIDRRNVFKHPHMQRATLAVAFGCFTFNMAMELVLLRNKDHVPIIAPFNEVSCLQTLVLTCLLVPLFVGSAACMDAKKAVSHGYFPHVRWPLLRSGGSEPGSRDASCCKTCHWYSWTMLLQDPMTFYLLPLVCIKRERLIPLVASLWYFCLFAPIPMATLLVVHFSGLASSVPYLPFAFAKASFSAAEALAVFIPVYLLVASSPNNMPDHHFENGTSGRLNEFDESEEFEHGESQHYHDSLYHRQEHQQDGAASQSVTPSSGGNSANNNKSSTDSLRLLASSEGLHSLPPSASSCSFSNDESPLPSPN